MIIRKWKHATAVVVGKDHIADSSPCQDKTAYARQNNIHVIALSDGAGSRAKSDIGAQIAVNTVCELMCTHFDDVYLSLEALIDGGAKKTASIIVERIVSAINKVKGESEISDFACTLLFVAMKNEKYVMGHLGDGVIGGLYFGRDTDELRVLSAPENGGAPNLTYFVTENDASQHLRLYSGEFSNLKGLILMSDGPEESLFNDGKLHLNTKRLFENFKELTESKYCEVLADFLRMKAAKYSDDDLSLNVLFLEDADSKKISEGYKNYLFSDIISRNQIIKQSAYCMFLDNSFTPKKTDDISDIRRIV